MVSAENTISCICKCACTIPTALFQNAVKFVQSIHTDSKDPTICLPFMWQELYGKNYMLGSCQMSAFPMLLFPVDLSCGSLNLKQRSGYMVNLLTETVLMFSLFFEPFEVVSLNHLILTCFIPSQNMQPKHLWPNQINKRTWYMFYNSMHLEIYK